MRAPPRLSGAGSAARGGVDTGAWAADGGLAAAGASAEPPAPAPFLLSAWPTDPKAMVRGRLRDLALGSGSAVRAAPSEAKAMVFGRRRPLRAWAESGSAADGGARSSGRAMGSGGGSSSAVCTGRLLFGPVRPPELRGPVEASAAALSGGSDNSASSGARLTM
jgi:hypothetical protein